MANDKRKPPSHTPLSAIFGEPDLGKFTGGLMTLFSDMYQGIESIDGFQKLPKITQRALEAAPDFVEMSARRIADEGSTPEERMEAAEDLMIAVSVVAPYVRTPEAIVRKLDAKRTARARAVHCKRTEDDVERVAAILQENPGIKPKEISSAFKKLHGEDIPQNRMYRWIKKARTKLAKDYFAS
jgi:hypothetical protein